MLPDAKIDRTKKIGFFVNCFEGGLWYYSQAIAKHYKIDPWYLSIRPKAKPQHLEEFPLNKICYDTRVDIWALQNRFDIVVVFEGKPDVATMLRRIPLKINIINWELCRDKWVRKMAGYNEIWFPTECAAHPFSRWHGHVHIMRGVDWAPDVVPLPKALPNPVIVYHNCGMVGLHERKNTRCVIEAFRMVFDKDKNIKLVITTQKNIEDMLSYQCPNLVILQKTFNRKELISFYQKAHIVVQPSKREGFGVPLYEALKANCYLITTDAPPMNEIPKSDKTAFLRPTGQKAVMGSIVPLKTISSVELAEKILHFAHVIRHTGT